MRREHNMLDGGVVEPGRPRSTLSYGIIEGSTELPSKKLRFQTRVIFARIIEKTLIFYRLALTRIASFKPVVFRGHFRHFVLPLSFRTIRYIVRQKI